MSFSISLSFSLLLFIVLSRSCGKTVSTWIVCAYLIFGGKEKFLCMLLTHSLGTTEINKNNLSIININKIVINVYALIYDQKYERVRDTCMTLYKESETIAIFHGDNNFMQMFQVDALWNGGDIVR